ncbi:MAG: TolC family protein [Verrucomicrobiae bacterium]|nr:TolC family protein [Verrucomicrobiae bacterium]
MRLALLHHPGAREGAWRVEAAEGRAKQMRLWPNPELEFSAEEMPTDGGGFGASLNQAGISQTVPFPGKSVLDGRIGRLAVQESEAGLGVLRAEIERDAKVAFFRALAAEGLVSAAKELADLVDQASAVARERARAGAIPEQELLRAEIASEQALAELSGHEAERLASRQALAAAIGLPGLGAAKPVGALRETADLSSLAGDRASAVTAHPSVVAAAVALDRADTGVRRAQLEPMPDVTLGVSAGRDEAAGAGIMGFRVSVPLPLIDRSQGKAREARAEAAIAEAELDAARQRMARDLVTAEVRLRAADGQVATYRERILPKARQAAALVRAGYEGGKLGFIDWLDTQRTLAEARIAYQQKLFELNAAQAEIEALLVGPRVVNQP